MILLIQELQEKYDLLDENLNSIMILLIHIFSICWTMIAVLFKFHYDSINSLHAKRQFFFLDHNLNSIMILLIRQKRHLRAHPCKKNLNSIMILLIPVPKSSPYLSQKTSLFCRPLQNSTFLSCP